MKKFINLVLHHSINCCKILSNGNELFLGDSNRIRIFNIDTWLYKKIETNISTINV